MANAMNEMQCSNFGCGQKFAHHENHPEACSHHPGDPIDHETHKGYSCCDHRTTDHEEFLNIKGCSKGHHNPDPSKKSDKSSKQD